MATRRHHHGDDPSARRYRTRDAPPAPVSRPSRETTRSSAIVVPESARGTNYPTSHVRNDNGPGRSLSEPQIPLDVHERVDDDREPRKRSTASLAKDQGSVHQKEEEQPETKSEQSRSLKEEGQSLYDGDRTNDRRDAPRGVSYPSLRENADIYRPLPAHSKDAHPTASPSASFQRLYEEQLKELVELRQERRAALEEKKALADAYEALRLQYEERSKKLSVVRHERQAALAQRKEIDDAYVALRHQYDEQTKKLNAVRHERQTALEQKQKAEEECAALTQKCETQKKDLNALSNKYNSTKATLEQRTSELQGVQKFLTTADTFSGSEVVNMLRKINEQVQQSTTFMAEWAVDNFELVLPPADEKTSQDVEQTRTSETLGTRFMQLLGMRKHKENPILLEMAFRAYLIYELYCVASPWSIGQEEQSHIDYMDTIYQRIRETEGQAVSGNWRALTRAYTLPACISDPEVAHVFDTTIASGLSDILSAAGCTTSKSDMLSAFWSKFGEKIHDFVSLAGQVHKAIGVGVVSEDFEVLAIWPDVVYDEREMEDAYDNGDRIQGAGREEIVLCATELGLMQRMKVGANAAKPSEFIVIKPKVALVSVLDMIDG